MSSPVDGNGKRGDPSAYAPKWVRDSNREGSRENTTFQQSEQSVPEKAPASDQARAHRPLDAASLTASLRSLREARVAPRARRPLAEREPPEGSEQPPLHMPRSLDPEFVRKPPPAPRALGRLATLAGLVIAASIGAAIALFATGKLPSELLGLSAGKTAAVSRSRPAGDTLGTPEQPSSLAARPPTASTDPPTHRRGYSTRRGGSRCK